MNLRSKLQISMVIAGALLACWQFGRHRQGARELACIEAQLRTEDQKLEAGRAALADLERQDSELVETERRAGNQTLISLMRERAAAAAAASEAAGNAHNVGSALAKVLDSPDQQGIDRDARRNEMRANLGLFFKLVNMPAERIGQYIDLQIEKESRNASRMSALLRGNMTVESALRERHSDNLEQETKQRALLEPAGCAFLDSIAEGMRNDEAKRLVGGIEQGMGSNRLDGEQRERLQGLIKTELVTLPLDDIDLFRSPEEWAQIVEGREQNVLRAAADFLTQTQLEILRTLAAGDLADRKKQMVMRRKALGIK